MVLSGTGASARTRFLAGLAIAVGVLAALLAPASAAVAAGAPEWRITSYESPANLPPQGSGEIVVVAVNVGAVATDGSTIEIEDQLPSGLKATSVSGYDRYADGPLGFPSIFIRPNAKLTCTAPPELKCSSSLAVPPGDQLVMNIKVEAGEAASLTNRATVSGGGAAQGDSIQSPVTVSNEPAKFGIAPGSAFAAVSSHRAGAHPDVTTGFAINEIPPHGRGIETKPAEVAGDAKDVYFDLPPGLVGNTVGMPTCTAAQAVSLNCPASTIVGLATTYFRFGPETLAIVTPVFNIKPAPGEPAAFMFTLIYIHVRLDTTLLSDGNYGVRVGVTDLTQAEPVLANYVTIWGVPADHQGEGSIPIYGDQRAGVGSVGAPSTSSARVPLLRNPTQCTQSMVPSLEADAWRDPGVFQVNELGTMGTLTGCLEEPFGGSFTLLPDTLEAGKPAGYDFDLHVRQQNLPDAPAASDVKKVALTLPEGVVVNPSAAWGLKVCSAEQFYGKNHPSQELAPLAQCPREAQVGQVTVKTPALEEPFEGDVYLGEPECHPCTPQDSEDGKMVKLYVQLVSANEGGIVVKLEGKAMIDQKTGQITTVFDENPQLPFSEFKLKLAGGPRSVLANPRTCGTVKATGDLQPWSILQAPGEAQLVSEAHPSYEFEINQNCFAPQFHPSLKAGSPNIQSGAYTPFTLAFGRSDEDQFLGSLSMTMPPGLLGNIGSVPLCKEPQAAQGTCDAASQIGQVEALTGPGANPFLVSGGHVFLTEGYRGAPYGLSIVVPAVAGPYTLSGTTGKGTVVVRAKIEVDPIDAHLTVTSDPLPTVLDGIPLQLKAVNVRIDRPQFTFNPTSCAKMGIGATLDSAEGMSARISTPFQVTNCASLAFKPQFKASTSGKTNRVRGASLTVNLAYPKAAWGSQANIAKVKVSLPKQLPSRLATLQKACTDTVFEQNPAACPVASRVGSATATTPIIPVALTGPAYFVSHGGAKFPELVVVLSGYGVTVQLHGETFISKAGITSSTFRQVPDVPIGSFHLTLPQGPNSALAANGDLCRSRLRMPTAFTAQNGMVIHRSTPISATGCAKHKKHAHKKHTHKKHAHKRKHKKK